MVQTDPAPYVTVTKLLNLALNVAELKLNFPLARSLPPFLKVETTPDCQMACPGCHHGSREKKELMVRREQLRLENFKRIIEPIHRTTLANASPPLQLLHSLEVLHPIGFPRFAAIWRKRLLPVT